MLVGDADVPGLLGADIVAFQLAEPGAMGWPGGVFFVTSDRKVYRTCYLEPSDYSGMSKSMSTDNLKSVFPPLKEFRSGLMGRGVESPDGWHHTYLGMGNHLLVKKSIKGEFEKKAAELLEKNPGAILYNVWMDAVLGI